VNFSAGAMDRLGLGYEDLRPHHPGLIYLSASGYGQQGPRSAWTSMNMNLQAYSGSMLTTGAEDDPPTTVSASLNDYLGALHGCVAVLNALAERKATGLGAYLDMFQFECSVAALGGLVLAASVNKALPPRMGNRAANVAPQGCYPCAGSDEWCAISVQTDDQWRALVSLLSDVSALADPRFSTLEGRLQCHDEIDALIEGWTRQRPNHEVDARLKEAGIPAERMRRTRDILEDPATGRFFQPIEDPSGYFPVMSRLPFTFSQTSVADMIRAPHVGEHTCEVLQDWLGLTESELTKLETEGALA
jgi:benzylsuccinate CoA-transferase BbsF subunit